MAIRHFYTKIAGISHYQEAAGHCEPFELLRLVRDYNNPRDYNAVAVISDRRELLGYLKAKVAAELAKELRTGVETAAWISEITGGGEDKPTTGINLLVAIGAAGTTLDEFDLYLRELVHPATSSPPRQSRRWRIPIWT